MMELLTTFYTIDDAERAKELLEKQGLPFTVVEPTDALHRVAITALVMTSEVRGELGEWQSLGVTGSGWVEYEPASCSMPEEPPQVFEEDLFGAARITTLAPCVADETRIRIIAEVSGDLQASLPYLNALNGKASLTADGRSLSFMDGHRTVVVYPDRIAAAKPDNIVDAWLMLERIRRLVNETWARRHEIEPCYVTRTRPPALEIFKRLPGTNCGLCGELTCMALALRVSSGDSSVSRCTPMLEPGQEQERRALLDFVTGLGQDQD